MDEAYCDGCICKTCVFNAESESDYYYICDCKDCDGNPVGECVKFKAKLLKERSMKSEGNGFRGMHTIGYWHDKPQHKKSLLCLLGFHRASRYIFVKYKGKDYLVCRKCGKRYEV